MSVLLYVCGCTLADKCWNSSAIEVLHRSTRRASGFRVEECDAPLQLCRPDLAVIVVGRGHVPWVVRERSVASMGHRLSNVPARTWRFGWICDHLSESWPVRKCCDCVRARQRINLSVNSQCSKTRSTNATDIMLFLFLFVGAVVQR